MRTRYCGIVLLTFILAATLAINGSSVPVSADSCVETLGYSSLSTSQYYYNSNIAITVPVSATCAFVSNQLYAVGTAYDTASNSNLGSVSTALTAAYGNTFTGQLVFNLSPSVIGHQVQVTVSIYSGYPYGYYAYTGNGASLATAVQLLRVNVNNYLTATTINMATVTIIRTVTPINTAIVTRVHTAIIQAPTTAITIRLANQLEAATRCNVLATCTRPQMDV